MPVVGIMTKPIREKIQRLKRRLRSLESAVVAFSGGVDSSVLLECARMALERRVIAVTASSPSLPKCDVSLIEGFCAERDIEHSFIETAELDDPKYASNPEDRCYHCKRHLMERLMEVADRMGFEHIVEGTNASDLGGHRPGHRASSELDRVVNPLIDEGFTKDDVREAARELGLSVADKPSAACLASRIPMGTAIDAELLSRVDAAEDVVRKLGAGQVRVRHHGDTARIEVEGSDIGLIVEHRAEIAAALKSLGWKYISLDMEGYRTGSLSG